MRAGMHEWVGTTSQEKLNRSLGARVSGTCDQSDMGAMGLNSGPLGKQKAFLTAVPSLQDQDSKKC